VSVLRTQLAGVARRPARLLMTGLAMLVASFVVYATVLAQQITERTLLDGLSRTPAAVDLVVGTADVNSPTPQITTADLAKIKAVPGVAEAVGRVEGSGDASGQYLNLTADPGSGPLALTKIAQGRYPSAPNEVAVTARTADRTGLPVGTTVSMVTSWTEDGKPDKRAKVRITGLVEADDDFGSTMYAPQSTITALSHDNLLQQIDLRLAPGADAATVQAAVEQVVQAAPAPKTDYKRPDVLTGTAMRTQEAEAASDDLDELFAIVGMFVAIAVVAAGLVATSTFRIIFAQRMRQLALLRAVGAGRGSISRALAVEGAVTGLVAGAVGVLGALAVCHAVPPIVRAFDVSVASPGLPLLPAAGVVLLSMLITVLAVLAPAASAAKVSPLEALRSSSTTAGRTDIGKLRWAFGLLLALGAAASAGYVFSNLPAPDAKDYNPEMMLLTVVVSGALAFFALVALGPVLVRPVLAAVGWPLRRLGPVGRLAVGGVGGAPRRAAAVSVVVALGVTLIAGVVVTGASARVLTERELAATLPADFEVTAGGDSALSAAALDQARASKDLRNVAPYRRLTGIKMPSGGTEDLETDATDLDLGALPTLAGIDVTEGSVASRGPGKAVIDDFMAEFAGLKIGDKTTVTAGKKKVDVTVVATLPRLPLNAGLMLDPGDLTKLGASKGYAGLLADAATTGEDARTAGQKALRQVTQGGAGIGVTVLADQRDEAIQVLNGVLAVALALIGLTVLIAVVGVGTTTALSVVERVRESGLLRAVGLNRGALRTMLTAESSLYGVIGATIGLVLGIPYAWLSLEALNVDAPLELPVWQLAAVFLALVAFTALAGVLPARKAARVSPVAALATDG
jgi:putative ABC transport system permease protein